MIGVYKITSPSGKIYIGSSINIPKRFHYYKLKRCQAQIKLYNSLMKHGVSSHVFEVVVQCQPDELRKLEAYYGNLFKVLEKDTGLNLRLPTTDEFPQSMNDEVRKRLSEGALKSYDRRGRVTDDPGHHQKRLAKRRIRENAKYQPIPKEQQLINRKIASNKGWSNPNRKIKKLTPDEKREAKRLDLIQWRAKNADKNKQINKNYRLAKKDDPAYVERIRLQRKRYRDKYKSDPDHVQKKAIANNKWYFKKKAANLPPVVI